MVLNRYRDKVDRFLLPLARKCHKVPPNLLTFFTLVFATITVFFYYLTTSFKKEFLLAAALSLFLSSLFDALDGKVARFTNTISKKGDLYDHVVDRYADILLVGGLFLTGYAGLLFVFLALTGVFMTSYMGTQAQALSAKRHYGGFLGRADRLVLLNVFLIIQYIFILFELGEIAGLTPLEFLLLIFFFLGHATALLRFRDTAHFIENKGGEDEHA